MSFPVDLQTYGASAVDLKSLRRICEQNDGHRRELLGYRGDVKHRYVFVPKMCPHRVRAPGFLDHVKAAVSTRASNSLRSIPPAGGRPYNAYVHKVDALIQPTQAFRSMIADVLNEQVGLLLAALADSAGERRHSWLRKLIGLVEQDSELRLDLYYILVAFGCSGAVDVVAYLQQSRNTSRGS